MKRIFVTILALILTASVFAQTDKAKGNKSNREWNQHNKGDRKDMMKDLDLTESQRTQMKSINENFRNQMQSLKNDKTLSAEQLKQRRQELAQEHKSKIENILTSDQKKIWKDKRDEMREDRKEEGGKKGRRTGKFENKMDRHEGAGDITKNLNLSSEQQKQVATLNQKFRTNTNSIRTNTLLTKEQKQEQLKELHKDHKQSIESLLTSDQKKQLKESMKNNRRNNPEKITR